jgi:hypothetical protein
MENNSVTHEFTEKQDQFNREFGKMLSNLCRDYGISMSDMAMLFPLDGRLEGTTIRIVLSPSGDNYLL